MTWVRGFSGFSGYFWDIPVSSFNPGGAMPLSRRLREFVLRHLHDEKDISWCDYRYIEAAEYEKLCHV